MGIQVAIIGLDAATFDVILPLIGKGELPHLKRLMDGGTWGPLRSTYPPVSVPAWVSCITGKGPGKHGLLDFRHYAPDDYTGRGGLVNSSDFSGSTVFDILSRRQRRIGAFRVPLTYPPWPVNGFMVSGQPTPDRRKAYAYPEGLAEEVGDLHREEDIKQFQYFKNEVYREHILWDTERHVEAAVDLLEKRGDDLDLFMMVLNSLDAAQHRFWKYRDDAYPFHVPEEREKYRETVDDFYRRADEGVGRIVSLLPPDATILVVSDHGARLRPHRTVHLNTWLSEMGILRLHAAGAGPGGPAQEKSLGKKILSRLFQSEQLRPDAAPVAGQGGMDWAGTRAYRFPMYLPLDGIEINLAGRQPQGCVRDKEEYERIRSLILSEIEGIKDPETGAGIVQKAWRKEDLYSGNHLDRIPDIVVRLNEQYEGGGAIRGPLVTLKNEKEYEVWNGSHSLDGILIACGPAVRSVRSLKGAGILDIAPTVLYAMGEAVPEDMDGKVLAELFDEEFSARNRVRYEERNHKTTAERYILSEKEEAEMKEKLRVLGYIE